MTDDAYESNSYKTAGYADTLADRADDWRKGTDLYTHDEGHPEGDQWQKLTNPNYWSE